MNKKFTLSELVLTVGCAAVIGALTIAASGSMATNPKTAACANNMRILEQKLTAWENANDGHMISQRNCGRLWGAQLMDSGLFDKTGYYGKLKIYPKRFDCPAETRQRTNGKVNIAKPSVNIPNAYDYGLNHYVHQRVDTPGKKLAKRTALINPKEIMRMTDSITYRVSNNVLDGTDRHGKGAGNVLFGDGHVAFMDTVPFKGASGYNGRFWFNAK